MLGMLPAHQGLGAHQLAIEHAVARLEMQEQLVLLDGMAQVTLQAPPFDDPHIHVGA